MANLDLLLDSIELTNGRVLQNFIRIDTITGDGRLFQRLIDDTDGRVVAELQFPTQDVPPGAGPSFVLPFGDGGFGVLASFGSTGPLFQAFDAEGEMAGDPVTLGPQDDGTGLPPITSIQGVFRGEDGAVTVATSSTIEDFSNPFNPSSETFLELRSFGLDGSISPEARLDSILPVGSGLVLPDGRLLSFSGETAMRPGVISTVLDPTDGTVETGRTQTRSTVEGAVNEYDLTVIKQTLLPGTNRFVVAWSQISNSGNPDNDSIFFAFGTTARPEGRLFGLTQLSPDHPVFDNFELLALPDGSFVIAWTLAGETGAGGDPLDGAQVVWRRFDPFGDALGDTAQVETEGQNEIGVSVELLGDRLLLSTSVFDDPDQGTKIEDRLLDLNLSPFSEAADIVSGTEAGESFDGLGGDDEILAGAGDDTLIGGAGDDTLRGEEGADILIGGVGSDAHFGGAGRDLASYASAAKRIAADLQGVTSGLGEASGDTFVGIEDLTGGLSNDILRGDGGTNVLSGGSGADRLYGRAGDDNLLGENGNDVLYGNTGADFISGGDGFDRFVYFRAGDSGTGRAARDVITDFDAARGERIELSQIGRAHV